MRSFEEIYDDEPPEVARMLLLPHAEGGDPIAQFYLGHLCDEGSPRDQAAAVSWYERSSSGGYLEATHWLASHLYHGIGIQQDLSRALILLRSCAEAGLDASQWKLGQHLLSQQGAREEAVRWLKLAATQGHPAAIELLEQQSGENGA